MSERRNSGILFVKNDKPGKENSDIMLIGNVRP